jgi:hypothetical protein
MPALTSESPQGPLVFLLCFGFALLLKGKVQFGFIYGLGMLGCGSIWLLLNLMSHDIDLATSTSILGYCLLPMVAVAYLSLIFKGVFLTILVIFSIALCTWRATAMFVHLFRLPPVLMLCVFLVVCFFRSASIHVVTHASNASADSNAASDQKFLVAYPVALFYLTFSMLTMF